MAAASCASPPTDPAMSEDLTPPSKTTPCQQDNEAPLNGGTASVSSLRVSDFDEAAQLAQQLKDQTSENDVLVKVDGETSDDAQDAVDDSAEHGYQTSTHADTTQKLAYVAGQKGINDDQKEESSSDLAEAAQNTAIAGTSSTMDSAHAQAAQALEATDDPDLAANINSFEDQKAAFVTNVVNDPLAAAAQIANGLANSKELLNQATKSLEAAAIVKTQNLVATGLLAAINKTQTKVTSVAKTTSSMFTTSLHKWWSGTKSPATSKSHAH